MAVTNCGSGGGGAASGGAADTATSAEGLLHTVTQTGHGFTALMPIYFDGTEWKKARANTINTLATHVVIAATDANTFTCSNSGRHMVTGHGKTVSSWYYTSAETIGGTTATEPTDQNVFSNSLFLPIDANTIDIYPFRANRVSDEEDQRYTFLMSGGYS